MGLLEARHPFVQRLPRVGEFGLADRRRPALVRIDLSFEIGHAQAQRIDLRILCAALGLFGEPRQADAVDECHGTDEQQPRSEEHTSELQSLMRNSYAVFFLKKKKKTKKKNNDAIKICKQAHKKNKKQTE